MVSKFPVRQGSAVSGILGSLLCWGWAVAPAIAIPSTATPLQIRPAAIQTPELPSLDTFTAYQPLPPEDNTIRLVLRLGERQVYVYQGAEAIATYPVAIGRPDTPTPTGEFQIFETLEDPSWRNPRTGEVESAGADGSLGTRWIGFAHMPNGVIGFHGTPNRASIGRAASHGCVRMRNEDVVALFARVTVGTVVTVEP
jgi:lipoprotein-anchoring transpeptidase ErfK/SrfK